MSRWCFQTPPRPGRLRQVQQLSFTGGANEEVTQDEVYAIVKSLRQDKPDLHHDDLVEMAVDMVSQLLKFGRDLSIGTPSWSVEL